MKASYDQDPLRRLGKKALRRLARQYKIKHFYRKSPASLRRAIRRAQEQADRSPVAATAARSIKAASGEELEVMRREAELKAYEEHRLRYLFMPSRFVHKGTHEEFLLEKDEEIDLPDFYQENELVAMPVDPYRLYVYWDFDEETLFDVRSWLAEDNRFLLRLHDVSSLVFDGSNAHNSWESNCHPLVREWYLNAPVNGRDMIVELGVIQPTGFRALLRSNPVYVPPASVSSITGDIFAHFVPGQPRETDQLRPVQPAAPMPPKPETSAHLFFQEYVPTPIRFHPSPPPKHILARRELSDQAPPDSPAPPVFWSTDPPSQQPGHQTQPEPIAIRVPSEAGPAPEPIPVRGEPQRGEVEWSESDVLNYLREGGSVTLQEWLGLPHAIRWLSDLPSGMSPVFFQHWIDDPYDRALMVSYAIWPWEITEYLPLGASDWTLRKFLGASLFSWFRPGGSERMIWWQQPRPGASESIRWLRPMGASELSWS
ncbi:MAG: hypothetical protein CVV27_09805, partial [Candidatus Melainabacteria bacterium HGW-Melainabacteria-1]